MKNKIFLISGLFAIAAVASFFYIQTRISTSSQTLAPRADQDAIGSEDVAGLVDSDVEVPPAAPTMVSSTELASVPKSSSALGGYNLLIADRGNNRLIELNPDKQIIWSYHFALPKPGLGADDSFFTADGKYIITNLEEYHLIQIIDLATKKVVWSYGTPGQPGHGPNQLNTPDDAYLLPNGDVVVADIKNCRIIEIAPDKHIVRQYGVTRVCSDKPGYLNLPNGDTPLSNGHMLISNIVGHSLIELDANWKQILTLPLPLGYPSDPQPTADGNIIVADYSKPGRVIEINRNGKIVWDFFGAPGDVPLDHPSLAEELPNGNVMINDDLNHRVIIVDKQTKKIVWQYGVTGKAGANNGMLNTPDGMSIILPANQAITPVPAPGPVQTVGHITRNAEKFINTYVTMSGYLLKKENGYIIFSDEATGSAGRYDLPVTGIGIDAMKTSQKYLLSGFFMNFGLAASNQNPDHLELESPPQPIAK